MYTLAHGHFADFDDVPDPATLDKSELPSGALILALQAVSLSRLWPATVVYHSDYDIRFLMLSVHGRLVHTSKTLVRRVFFPRISMVTESDARPAPMGR